MEIRQLGPPDLDVVLSAGKLFDGEPMPSWTRDMLERDGHHLLMAFVEGVPAGFASGMELAHPDKAVELLLYELGVDRDVRRQGIGRALVVALLEVARDRGCRSMWVPIESGDEVAEAVYRSAGAGAVEAAGILVWDLDA